MSGIQGSRDAASWEEEEEGGGGIGKCYEGNKITGIMNEKNHRQKVKGMAWTKQKEE